MTKTIPLEWQQRWYADQGWVITCQDPACDNDLYHQGRLDQRYCNAGCKQAAYRARQADVARQSKLKQATCKNPACGQSFFVDQSSRKLYCDDTCKQNAYRARTEGRMF